MDWRLGQCISEHGGAVGCFQSAPVSRPYSHPGRRAVSVMALCPPVCVPASSLLCEHTLTWKSWDLPVPDELIKATIFKLARCCLCWIVGRITVGVAGTCAIVLAPLDYIPCAYSRFPGVWEERLRRVITDSVVWREDSRATGRVMAYSVCTELCK